MDFQNLISAKVTELVLPISVYTQECHKRRDRCRQRSFEAFGHTLLVCSDLDEWCNSHLNVICVCQKTSVQTPTKRTEQKAVDSCLTSVTTKLSCRTAKKNSCSALPIGFFISKLPGCISCWDMTSFLPYHGAL